MADLKILGIPGSLRKASFNRSALVAAQSLLPAGASLDVFELEGIPVYNQDLDKQPPARVVELKARVRAADAILFATPEYNYSIPGVLKNAIDWASRPMNDSSLSGKPLAIMGAGGMGGTIRAQLALRQLSTSINTLIINRPQVQIMRSWEKFDAEGKLTDEQARQEIRALLEALAAWTRRLRGE